MKRMTCLLAMAGAWLCLFAPRATAQCQVPLIIGSASSTANVLLIQDTSGSMNEPVLHPAYDKNTNYSGNFSRTSRYDISADGNYTPRSFKSWWPNTPSAYLVNSDGGHSGRYFGNYLNWIFFHATAAERTAIPAYTKIQGAKAVLDAVLTNITTVRFAIETFNGDNGGKIISPFGTDLVTMQSQVSAIVGDSWTPLAESMEDALDYYKQTGIDAPIQASCQKSFAILITDGLPTQDVNVSSYLRSNDCLGNDPGSCTSMGTGYSDSWDCSNYLDNVTCYLYRNDMRSDLSGIQNVATFTIGFDIDTPFLQDAANIGGGEYYTANDVDGLIDALSQAFNTIAKRVAAGTSVAVVSAEDRTNSQLFRARYESGTWRGYVEAFDLPFMAGQPPRWEAGALLAARTPSSRALLTSLDGTNVIDFSASNASALMSPLAAANTTEATNIINYVRGEAVTGYRDRGGWVLGDVVDASPIAVGKPTGFSSLPGYAGYRSANATRPEVVYAGANDGMLHAFDASNGEEMWAYLPKSQLSNLKALTDPGYCHQYYLNSTPVAYDVKIGSTWKTVLYAGEDPFTNGVFALDITDPTTGNMDLLWDVDVPRLRGSWNTPTLVRDKLTNSSRLCIGTGYSSSAVSDSMVVLDPGTGALVARIGLGSAVAGNKTTRAVAVDTDFDDYQDVLYLGDLAGRLWRVDMRTNPWTRTLLFSGTQPIQATPVVTVDALGRPMVFFGTGQFLIGSDPSSTTLQSIYAVVDDGSGTTYARSDLVNQSISISAVSSGSPGWFVDLENEAGERVTRTAALISGTLYVTSFRPSVEACGGGGQSWLYSLDFEDGSAPDNSNGTENQVASGRSESMGDGMIADPTIDLVNEALLLQSSNAVVISHTIPGGLKKLMVRGWHRKWN